MNNFILMTVKKLQKNSNYIIKSALLVLFGEKIISTSKIHPLLYNLGSCLRVL